MRVGYNIPFQKLRFRAGMPWGWHLTYQIVYPLRRIFFPSPDGKIKEELGDREVEETERIRLCEEVSNYGFI